MTNCGYLVTLVSRRQEEVVEVGEEELEKTCIGKFLEKVDHFNRSRLKI